MPGPHYPNNVMPLDLQLCPAVFMVDVSQLGMVRYVALVGVECWIHAVG
jgi:hypothetical protein